MPEPWFHVAGLPARGEVVELDADEARHARGARRLEAGNDVVLFDGRGHTARAELCAVSRRSVRVRALSTEEHARPEPALHVVSALPKGDRLAQLLAMATQLGMASFTPLRARRSVNQPGARAHERWTRILCESCKQSRRAWLPTLAEPCAPEDVAAWAARRGPVVLLDPSGEPAATLVAQPALRRAPDVWLVVGPEGGLDDDERGRLLGGGARPMSLSDGILRIETAVVAGLALLGQLRD